MAIYLITVKHFLKVSSIKVSNCIHINYVVINSFTNFKVYVFFIYCFRRICPGVSRNVDTNDYLRKHSFRSSCSKDHKKYKYMYINT